MVDKVAVPFWLCWSAGMVLGLVTDNLVFWLGLSAAIGLALGLILRARALRNRRRILQSQTRQVDTMRISPAFPENDIESAA
jgi:hypothetical protein